MKNKKKIAIPFITILLGVILILLGIYPSIRNKNQAEDYQQENLELYGELNIISDSRPVDGNPHSLSGFKEAVRLGANTVTLDLCFKRDGTPVITDSFDDINESTLSAEEIFKLMQDENYSDINVNFRLNQLGSLSTFNSLITRYGMENRVIISGIDKNRYSLIHGTDTPAELYFDYTPCDDIEETVNEVNSLVADYGISGVIINDASAELVDTFCRKGISFIVSDIDSESDIYKALSFGAYNLQTKNPQELKDIYTLWHNETLDRIDASILDELNK